MEDHKRTAWGTLLDIEARTFDVQEMGQAAVTVDRRLSQSLRTSTADNCGRGQCSLASRNPFLKYSAGTFNTSEG